MTDVTADGAETFTGQLADEMLAARTEECVACYVLRMLHQFGCAGTFRFTTRWCELQVPGAPTPHRPGTSTGATCDCELLVNAWEPSAAISIWNAVMGRYEPPLRMPPCHGHRARSARPCAGWQPRSRAD